MLTRARSRLLALGGVIGPTAFVTAWVGGAAIAGPDYSSLDDPISRLAADGAPTRAVMTTGFLVFGVGVSGFAAALRRDLGGPSWMAAAVAAGATALVACAPLDQSPLVDRLHGTFAGIGYLAVAAIPLLAAAPLFGRGERAWATAGVAAGAVSAGALAASLLGAPTGLFQRVGLTVADAWIVAMAASIVARTDTRFRSPRPGA